MPTKSRVDIVLVSDDPKEKAAVAKIAEEFSYCLKILETVEDVIACDLEPLLLIASQITSDSETSIDELLQLSRQQFPKAFIMAVVDKELTKDRFQFLRKLGARIVVLRSEINSAKMAFVINQYLKGSYVPLKTVDLVADQVVPFSLYCLLPSRGKFLILHRSGERLEGERLAKFGAQTELYISRDELSHYREYINATTDKSAKGLAKRCRANFIQLQSEFAFLALELTDHSNKVSFGDGQELLNRCQGLCADLLGNLAEFPNAWEIIDNSSVGGFGSLERSPAIAAYAGVFSLQLGLDRVPDIMMTALLVDIGVLTCDESIAHKLKSSEALSEAELSVLHHIPQKSIDMTLSRKVALSEKIRSFLMGVYENANGKGYPKGVHEEKLFVESQVIRYAKEFDKKTLLKLGSLRKNPVDALEEILSDKELNGVFASSFSQNAKEQIIKEALARRPLYQ